MFLRCCVNDTPRKWKVWLPLVEFWYNTSYHSSLGCTPFRVLYGYDPPLVVVPMLPDVANKTVQELIEDRQKHTALIKQHLAVAQNGIKVQADKHRTNREF
jgi:hypothetical protein